MLVFPKSSETKSTSLKWCLTPLYLLVIFMPLAGDQYDISLTCHYAGSADGFPAIGDRKGFQGLFFRQSLFHVGNDHFGFLIPWIIGSQDQPVAHAGRHRSHFRTLRFVTVAAGTHHGNDHLFRRSYLVYGVKHIFKGIGCMCIINNGGDTFV